MLRVGPPHAWDASTAVEEIRAGRTTSEALVTSCLERIGEREATVSAWQHLDPDGALAQARARDRRTSDGPLHGIPVGIKDVIDTADQPTTRGSPIFAGHRPPVDAEVVRRLRAAGAVIMGKTVTPEFAASGVLGSVVPSCEGFTPRRTTNPLDPSRAPGMSSSGSAAAVADHMVPIALGTQTAGSVLAPASFCGVYGFKPTVGRIPLDGVWVGSPSLDTIGLLARTVDDLELGAEVLAGVTTRRATTGARPSRPPRIGFVRTAEWEHVDGDTRTAIDEFVDSLRGSTFVRDATLPHGFAELTNAHESVMRSEISAGHERLLATHAELMSAPLRRRLDPALRPTIDEYHAAQDLAARCRRSLPAVFEGLDVLLGPVVPGEPPHESDMSASIFCRMWTLLGLPTVSAPVLRGPLGRPVGVQIIGPIDGDTVTLEATRWLEDHASG